MTNEKMADPMNGQTARSRCTARKSHVHDYLVKGVATYRIISDYLSSVRLITNASDNSIAQRIDCDKYGNVIADSGPSFQQFAFAGGIYEQHTKQAASAPAITTRIRAGGRARIQ